MHLLFKGRGSLKFGYITSVLLLAALPAFAGHIDVKTDPHKSDPATLHLECVAPTLCTLQTGSMVTAITTDSTAVLDLANEGMALSGEAFLGILVPNGTVSVANLVSFGSLETIITFDSGQPGNPSNLNESGLKAGYEFSALASASSQVGVSASSFTAYDWDLGAYHSAGKGSPGIGPFTVGPLPNGSVLISWVEYKGCTAGRTPLSKSLTVDKPPTVTPEPGSMALMGTFVLAACGALRRRFLT